MKPKIEMLHGDCLSYMATLKDKAFELAIVDPPYGVGDWQTVGDPNIWNATSQKVYGGVDWNDSGPSPEYFSELKRVSANQIIWGANYYNQFSPSGGAIVWDKRSDESRYSDGDIASCSLQKKITFFRFRWNGFLQENMSEKEIRIHSCQKPVALYRWLLHNYAKAGDRILDTHGGSGSSAIACEQMGFDMVWIEKDEDYYKAACKRFKEQTAQESLSFQKDNE